MKPKVPMLSTAKAEAMSASVFVSGPSCSNSHSAHRTDVTAYRAAECSSRLYSEMTIERCGTVSPFDIPDFRRSTVDRGGPLLEPTPRRGNLCQRPDPPLLHPGCWHRGSLTVMSACV